MSNLWTPDRGIVTPPRYCPRCGGVDRRDHPIAKQQIHDTRRFLGYHRVCCCGPDEGGTPTTSCSNFCIRVDINASGFCCWLESPSYYKITNPANGSYELTPNIVGSTWDIGAVSVATVHVGVYSDPDCTGQADSFPAALYLVTSGSCSGSTFTVNGVNLLIRPLPNPSVARFMYDLGTYNEGETITDATPCGEELFGLPYACDVCEVSFTRIVCGSL